MSDSVTIALDAMGGDHGPDVVVPAALDSLKRYPDLSLTLVGDEAAIASHVGQGGPSERIDIVHASQCVEMDELPSQALRYKKDSSMRVAVQQVKDGRADACVSAGNTGALLATARYVLKTLSGIDRPAIATTIPTFDGHTHMLDLGGNVDCTAELLFQFAVMGSVLASVVDGTARPRIGLLNVGEEEIKGNEQVKEAARLLTESDLNYVGYVEGDFMYKGGVDVVVADGFVGNISLKTMEGVARLVSQLMKQEFNRNLLTRLAGLVALPILRRFRTMMDPRGYNGASLLGLNGIVIKSHGGADSLAFANAVSIARVEAQKGMAHRIRGQLESKLAQRQAV